MNGWIDWLYSKGDELDKLDHLMSRPCLWETHAAEQNWRQEAKSSAYLIRFFFFSVCLLSRPLDLVALPLSLSLSWYVSLSSVFKKKFVKSYRTWESKGHHLKINKNVISSLRILANSLVQPHLEGIKNTSRQNTKGLKYLPCNHIGIVFWHHNSFHHRFVYYYH